MTADEGGNVFYTVASQGFNAVYKLDIKDPPLLAFASTVIDETSSDSPQVVTVSNFGNAGLEFNTLIYPADFPDYLDEKSRPVVVCDGGPAFWGIVFDPEANLFLDLKVNGSV